MRAKTSRRVSIERVNGFLERLDCSGVETKCGVGAEFGFYLIRTGWSGAAAKDVVDMAVLFAPTAEIHGHFSLEALWERVWLQRRPCYARGKISDGRRWRCSKRRMVYCAIDETRGYHDWQTPACLMTGRGCLLA
jgi:hypothetical protein